MSTSCTGVPVHGWRGGQANHRGKGPSADMYEKLGWACAWVLREEHKKDLANCYSQTRVLRVQGENKTTTKELEKHSHARRRWRHIIWWGRHALCPPFSEYHKCLWVAASRKNGWGLEDTSFSGCCGSQVGEPSASLQQSTEKWSYSKATKTDKHKIWLPLHTERGLCPTFLCTLERSVFGTGHLCSRC